MNSPDGGRKRSARWLALLGTIGLGAAIALGVIGILARRHSDAALVQATDEAAIPTVAVIQPRAGTSTEGLVLPGDIEAWYEAPIYGQVSGYVKMWYKDIGAVVKQGDLLAEIDTPDLDAHVEEAKAQLDKERANQELAEITAKRWQLLWKTDSVSRQETDVKTDDLKASRAATLAAKGELDRLMALEGFKRLIAPFDGVVTARRTDVGAFVKANGVSSEPEMFTVADIHIMRVYVRVPQTYAAQIHLGMTAELHLPQFPGKTFPATINTTSRAINLDSRTLLVELWAPNPKEELSPGTYADVHFALAPSPDALKIPTSALIFQDHGLQVAVVDAHSHAHLRNVTIGRDMGADVIVVSGISAADRVIDSPPDALNDGDEVRVVGTHGVFPGLENTHEQLSEAKN
jgi:RND family efflux transporter MFP subunit